MNQEGKPDVQAIVDALRIGILPALDTGLDNETLSTDTLERVRQLEQRAQQEEERISGGH